MSHNVKVRGVAIRSISALTRAVQNLAAKGIPISLEQRKRFVTFPGQDDRCDYAIHIEGANHEIGVVKSATKQGEYELVFDPYSGGRVGIANFLSMKGKLEGETDVGHAERCIGQLSQEHALCAAEDQLTEQGWSFERQTNAETGVTSLVAVQI